MMYYRGGPYWAIGITTRPQIITGIRCDWCIVAVLLVAAFFTDVPHVTEWGDWFNLFIVAECRCVQT